MLGAGSSSKTLLIPEIDKNKIRELAAKIRPVIRFVKGPNGLTASREGLAYYIQTVDPEKVAYTWAPKPDERAAGIKPLCEITTYHRFSWQRFFKPSVAEVLAQIPAEILDQVVAFEIVRQPESLEDLYEHPEALAAGYHVATTRLYSNG